MNELQKTLDMLEHLQSFLDMTDTYSEALDKLYEDIVEAKQSINNELRGL